MPEKKTMTVGENVDVRMEGSKLVIEIDTDYRGGLSQSGKTVRVASTLGNKALPCGVTIGINAYVKA